MNFTEHIKTLPAGTYPPDELLHALRRTLRQRLARRGLLGQHPRLLGSPASSWREEGALDDLVFDCYEFAVLDRLEALQNQLLIRDNIDGIVLRNVNNFLTERQADADPVGRAVYLNLRRVLRAAVEAGHLSVTAGPATVNARTRLAFSPTSASDSPDGALAAVLTSLDWGSMARSLVRQSRRGRVWLRDTLLPRLQQAGVTSFDCGELIRLVGQAVRAAWESSHSEGDSTFDPDTRTVVRLVRLDTSFADRDRWDRLVAEVRQRIAGWPGQQRRRAGLSAVFEALVQACQGTGDPPSQADLTRQFDISRSRLSELVADLRDIVSACRSNLRR